MWILVGCCFDEGTGDCRMGKTELKRTKFI